jgi:ACS family hexuronate transporter-like MFS transporter
LCVVPIFFASITKSLPVAMMLISLATAAHQGWSANLFTTTSDMFPKNAVSSVVGIGGMFGALGGAILAYFADNIIHSFGFIMLFTIAGINYLLALLIFNLLVPKLHKVMI